MSVNFDYPFIISADTPAVASQVQTNLDDLLTWIKVNYRQRDDTPLLTVMPTLPGTPTIPSHAATKAYADGIIPTGVVLEYGSTVLPDGFLWCDGASHSTTGIHAALFARIGYAYGGSGGNFNAPNMANRVAVGRGTGDFATLGATGGQADQSLLEHTHPSPAHTHTINHGHTATAGTQSVSHTHSAWNSGNQMLWRDVGDGDRAIPLVPGSDAHIWSAGTNFTGTTQSANHVHGITVVAHSGSSGPFSGDAATGATGTAVVTNDNYPLYVVMNYIIKT